MSWGLLSSTYKLNALIWKVIHFFFGMINAFEWGHTAGSASEMVAVRACIGSIGHLIQITVVK